MVKIIYKQDIEYKNGINGNEKLFSEKYPDGVKCCCNKKVFKTKKSYNTHIKTKSHINWLNINENDYKSCPELPNYLVSRDGKVIHKTNNNFLIGNINKYGRCILHLQKDGKSFGTSRHRLIGLVYWERPSDFGDGGKYQAAHLDEDCTNDHADNGEWQTSVQNGGDAARKAVKNKNNMGPSIPIVVTKDGVKTEYKSVTEACSFTGCSRPTIKNAITYNSVYNHMKFEYKFPLKDLLNEIWKPFPTKDGGNIDKKYGAEVSNMGRVRSKKVPNPRYGKLGGCGKYYTTKIARKSNILSSYIHILVCQAFNGGYEKGLHCCHLNNNSKDNRAENLKFATPKENNSHKTSEKRGYRPVKAISIHTGESYLFKSMTEAAEKLECCYSSISSIIGGEGNSNGWKFKDYCEFIPFPQNKIVISEKHIHIQGDWIKSENLSTGKITYFSNRQDASKELNIPVTNITPCLNNKGRVTDNHLFEKINLEDLPNDWKEIIKLESIKLELINPGPKGMKVKATNGNETRYYPSQIAVSKDLKILKTTISDILNGKNKGSNIKWKIEKINIKPLTETHKKIEMEKTRKRSIAHGGRK